MPFIVKKVSEHIGNSAYGSCNLSAAGLFVPHPCLFFSPPPPRQVLIDVVLVLRLPESTAITGKCFTR